MSRDLTAPGFTDSLTFCVRSGAARYRSYPFLVGPRSLTDTLVEVATGGSWLVEDVDANIKFKAAPGRVFAVPAEHAHRLQMSRGPLMRTRWVLITLEDEVGRDLLLQIPHAVLFSAASSVRAGQILERLNKQTAEGLAGRLAFQRLGFELVSILLQQCPSPLIRMPQRAGDRVEAVLRFIRDNLQRPLCRQELAKQAHLSPTRFHYVFLQDTGMAPMKYVLEQRIRRARQLLLSTNLASQEIGYQCGFESPPHFSRMFTRFTKVSPLQYRHQARQGE